MSATSPEGFFTRHAKAYRESPGHARGEDLGRLMELLGLRPRSHILDVATGPGHMAIFLARAGHAVTALDRTPAMLQEAADAARSAGVTIQLVYGDAAALPFPAMSFDAVTCRRAAHHFADLAAFLAEARRVLRPGGALGISDMTAPATAIAYLNRLERRRDPSHVAALTPEGWQEALCSQGLVLSRLETWEEPMSAEAWLAPVQRDEPQGEAAWAELRQAPREIVPAPGRFLKHRILLVAHRPGS